MRSNPVLLPMFAAILTVSVVGADESSDAPVNCQTLTGKVMCGYQGWFRADGDGTGIGWKHWTQNTSRPPAPDNLTVDLWPDLSEYGDDECYRVDLKHADGRIARVYSSDHPATIDRHFDWMAQYGIDGVFMQRFASEVVRSHHGPSLDSVLSHAVTAANKHGRAISLMYDLSGLRAGEVDSVRDDWLRLEAEMNLTGQQSYLHHRGAPVVSIWGIGFNDGRGYSLQECDDLVTWFKSQGCTVMIGVPSFWREGIRDATDDPLLHRLVQKADIISPWSVGRYATPQQASRHADQVWAADRQWCEQRGLDYFPVAFPGFSWHNMKPDSKSNVIPRLGGDFLWSQVVGAHKAGAKMLYVAMFDEVDEATAIFKCTNDPPIGDGYQMITYEGLPSDHYLKLVGKAGKLMRQAD